MYFPPQADSRRVFWRWVRIAFILAAVLLWVDEHSKVTQLTAQLTSAKSNQSPIQVHVPPAQIINGDVAEREKRRLISEHLGRLMAEGDKLAQTTCAEFQFPVLEACQKSKTAWEKRVGDYLRANASPADAERWNHEVTDWTANRPGVEIGYEVGVLSKLISELK
jgi:hypothetical protein